MATRESEVGFVPREMFAQPKAFGSVHTVPAVADGVEESDWRFRAAVAQHLFAHAVNENLRIRGHHRGEFLAPFAETRSLSAGRMGRVLRGEQIATIADVLFWGGHFPHVLKRLNEYLDWWVKEPERLREQEREELEKREELEQRAQRAQQEQRQWPGRPARRKQ